MTTTFTYRMFRKKVLLSDPLFTQAILLTNNLVNLVDGGVLLISLFPSPQVIATCITRTSGVSLLLGYATVVGNVPDFITQMTTHTRL
jgi:hypothetical protein